jgi:hypothetical protein
MTNYKLVNNRKGELCSVTKLPGGLSIGINPESRNYQEYLAWLAEGNEPLPADEP